MRALCGVAGSWLCIGSWATITFIIGGVMSPVLGYSDGLFGTPNCRISRHNNLETEFSSMSRRIVEHVVIVRPSPYENTPTTAYGSNKGVMINVEHEGTHPGSLWGDEQRSHRSGVYVRKIKIIGYISIKNLHAAMVEQIFGWSLPGILKPDLYRYTLKCTLVRNSSHGHGPSGNISTLRRNHSKPGDGDRFFRIFFLTIRDVSGQADGLSQSPRLDRKNDPLSDQCQKLHDTDYYQGSSQHT